MATEEEDKERGGGRPLCSSPLSTFYSFCSFFFLLLPLFFSAPPRQKLHGRRGKG